MKNQLKIVYANTHDCKDIHVWSGIPYYCTRALERYGVKEEFLHARYTKSLLSLPRRVYYRLFLGKRYNYFLEMRTVKRCANYIVNRLPADADVIICIGNFGLPVSALRTDKLQVT